MIKIIKKHQHVMYLLIRVAHVKIMVMTHLHEILLSIIEYPLLLPAMIFPVLCVSILNRTFIYKLLTQRFSHWRVRGPFKKDFCYSYIT